MYCGSDFEQFWSECRGRRIHPQDEPFFRANQQLIGTRAQAARFVTAYGPWPFDGPLDSAKVVICLANSRYDPVDVAHAGLIDRQRSGQEPLPTPWLPFYRQNIADPIGLPMAQLRTQVAVLNICPYPSSAWRNRSSG